MGLAMQYVHIKGLETEEEYPYEGVDSKCKYDPDKSKKNKIDGRDYIKKLDPNALLSAILVGPVSIAIEADTLVF